MTDLTTTYLGMTLKNPLVASASPLSEKVETVQQLEASGIAALVMYSLFEEQIIQDSLAFDRTLTYTTDSNSEAASYLPDFGRYNIGPETYLKNLGKLKQAVNIPVIGSLNGISNGGWVEYARKIEDAGANALELNIYNLSIDPNKTSAELEDGYIRLVSDIRSRINIPISVKLSPFFTGLANVLRRLADAGADGFVLFNRFYQPDFDLEELEIVPNLVLSTSAELRLPLRWIALLSGQVKADFALTSGVHTVEDVLKSMMAGARVAMMASELLKRGPQRAAEILAELQAWMEAHEYLSIHQMQGSMSAQAVAKPDVLLRTNYMKVLSSYEYLPTN